MRNFLMSLLVAGALVGANAGTALAQDASAPAAASAPASSDAAASAPATANTAMASSADAASAAAAASARIRCRARRADRTGHGRFLEDQLGRHRLDADLRRARAVHDDPGPRALLRGHGAQEERARHGDAELRDLLSGDDSLDRRRLQHRVHAGRLVPRRLLARVPARHGLHQGRQGDHAHREPPRHDDSGVGLLRVPADVRDHHAGAHHRRIRRPHEVLGDARVHGAVVADRLLAGRAHGLGTDRLAGNGWACSTSRAARWFTSTPVSRA